MPPNVPPERIGCGRLLAVGHAATTSSPHTLILGIPGSSRTSNGGAERVRTADLCVANAALSQLGNRPTEFGGPWPSPPTRTNSTHDSEGCRGCTLREVAERSSAWARFRVAGSGWVFAARSITRMASGLLILASPFTVLVDATYVVPALVVIGLSESSRRNNPPE